MPEDTVGHFSFFLLANDEPDFRHEPAFARQATAEPNIFSRHEFNSSDGRR